MPDLASLLDNEFAREMEGFYVPWKGATVPEPRLLRFNRVLADELGLPAGFEARKDIARLLSGMEPLDGSTPLAMIYAGHQFGQFSPQLGDGRALLIGEAFDRDGRRRDLHLKGSGPTPFSRRGDGKAALGPVLREYLIGEAMHALGIPTTRALAVVTTGETIYRDALLPGAVLTRVAASHLRVGTFEYFAARGDHARLKQLADYALRRHFPSLAGREDRYIALLAAVVERQANLVARWMLTGFIHGVMNTDNMTISGETIDYGPCAFMDRYNPETVFSSIDRQGRYAYGNQPRIGVWNLARFAESLLPLIAPDDPARAVAPATELLDQFLGRYQRAWLAGMRAKLGLVKENETDRDLAGDLLTLMARGATDYTSFFRLLADAISGDGETILAALGGHEDARVWLLRWRNRIDTEATAPTEISTRMNRVNPLYIPRNHRVEAALDDAYAGNMATFDGLLAALQSPFEARPDMESLAQPAPETCGQYQTFCGT
ncbi:MAG TPA: YdiU family protein [Rhabdaerophilum sp.]|nr:YdiU family protein [Rhabdaerophilum sp.]